MATTYRTPGVYIEEKPGPTRPIQGVGTSTAAFVGTAPNADAHVGEPMAINNWGQFCRELVDDDSGQPVAGSTDLSDAVFGFFYNGGQLVYVLNLGPSAGDAVRLEDLEVLSSYDVQIIAAPGYYDAATHDALLSHCEDTKSRMCVLDGPPEIEDLRSLVEVGQVEPGRSPGQASDDEDAEGGSNETDDEESPPPGGGGGRGGPSRGGYKPRDSDKGAFYVPRIYMLDPLGDEQRLSAVSGHVAGAWARNDAERGVHHAPANMVLRGAVNLQRRITDAEQGTLNEQGVNCIRFFSGRGTLIWGARTVASDPEWRYVPVRRLLTFIEQSILQNTLWAVFEPNGENLWKTLRLSVEAFLTKIWRDGALFGTTPEQAFFVQCDEETNPPEVRDAGMVVIRVGVAPLKPAEFVVFEVSQYEAGSEVNQQGVTRG